MGDLKDAVEGNKKFFAWLGAVKNRFDERRGVIGERIFVLYKDLVYVIEGRDVGDL